MHCAYNVKLNSKTCMCPRSGGKGQASGKTLYAVMNWNFPKTIFHVRKFKVLKKVKQCAMNSCMMQGSFNSYHSSIGWVLAKGKTHRLE
jgi:hypothetical protein